ncbi:MAG: TatD family hydrolase [Nanoarchaeota archaeon]|nr:TatD family hydrolase [Nanoarchaeota archaeon]
MVYIDVHCHIDMYSDEELPAIIERARKAGVGIIVNNGINAETNRKTLGLIEKYDDIKGAMGIYPCEALNMKDGEIEREIEFIRSNKDKIVAIGEVGLDFKEDGKEHVKQERVFRKMIELAKELDKPIIVHSRKAEERCIEILEEMKVQKVMMHCFSGKLKLVERIRDNGWFFSIPANVKNSEQFQNIVKMVDIKQLLCETDSPFLHPDREKNNEPANVVVSYEMIAKIKNLKLKEVEKQIEKNYRKLFE